MSIQINEEIVVGAGEGGGGGDALTADPLSQFAATTSAELAGVMTDETGTGQLVFNDNAVMGGVFTVNGGFAVKRVAGTDINSGEEMILGVTNTFGSRLVTIQSADIVGATRLFIIKDESGGAGVNNITIVTEGAETIDGVASVVIVQNYGVVRLYSDGFNLFSF